MGDYTVIYTVYTIILYLGYSDKSDCSIKGDSRSEISVGTTSGQNSLNMVQARYVPAKRDGQPFKSLGKPVLCEAKGYNGSYILLGSSIILHITYPTVLYTHLLPMAHEIVSGNMFLSESSPYRLHTPLLLACTGTASPRTV